MREALAKVSAAFGEDALILNHWREDNRVKVEASVVGADDTSVDNEATEAIETADATASAASMQPSAGDEGSSSDPTLTCLPMQPAEIQGAYRFVGTSGVGKTSTLIKLLVEWCMHNPAEDAVVMTTDDQRLGGTEALQLSCQLLGVDLKQVPAEQLVASVVQEKLAKLILIDTAAMEVQAPAAVPGVRDVLVLSAVHNMLSIQSQYDLAGGTRIGGCALTHLDQPFVTSDLTSWLAAKVLPLFWLSHSAYLPGGVEAADQTAVMRFLPATLVEQSSTSMMGVRVTA
ncbi:MAG: hypothetical protein AAF529_09280 [Pseudomonadota bacterium]